MTEGICMKKATGKGRCVPGLMLLAALLWAALCALALGEEYPESAHPYQPNTDYTWEYVHPEDADYLEVTFAPECQLEGYFDKLHLTDANGTTSYTGKELASLAVRITGDRFTLRLVTDASTQFYGFSITSVRAITRAEFNSPYYTVKDGKITGVKCGTWAGTMTVPAQIYGQTITAIGPLAFENCPATGITLPDTLKSIGNSAFTNCTNLRKITIPAGVTAIPANTFADCPKLEEVTLASDKAALTTSSFSNCPKLAQVHGMIDQIGLDTEPFVNCPSLVSISLSNHITALPNNILMNHQLILTIGGESPLIKALNEASHPYKIRETGEIFNLVADGAENVTEKVSQIIQALIRPGMSDYEMALSLHNWITGNAKYDTTNTYTGADGVLLHGTGTSQSYALAYQLLLNAVGIENCLERGNNHTWNMVKLGGEWYHVDAAWNDPINSLGKPGSETWNFFGVSNYALTGVANHECYDKPFIAAAYTYNWAYRNGLLDSRLNAVAACIEAKAVSGQLKFSFTHESFTAECYGIHNRTAFLIATDREYYINGAKANILSFTCDNAAAQFHVELGLSQPTFALPAFLKTIDEEAFRGTNAAVVWVPDGVTAIGPRAFADCKKLWQIKIPASVKTIDSTAFENVTSLIIFAPDGSAAQAFAAKNGYTFSAIEP